MQIQFRAQDGAYKQDSADSAINTTPGMAWITQITVITFGLFVGFKETTR
ncbi:MAG: hypothetical protein KTR35_09675 [Gammaproteobacteria bacterium]|nr:hypothetical protein [Gammaproteobacteria bacterium]